MKKSLFYRITLKQFTSHKRQIIDYMGKTVLVNYSRVILYLLTFLFCVLLTELFSLTGLFYLKNSRNIVYTPASQITLNEQQKQIIEKVIHNKLDYLVHSPSEGWTIKPNGSSGIFQANSQGIRANREYSLQPDREKTRISTYGDSFTHCDEVNNLQTWQQHMEDLDAQFEVINFGVAGYAVEQSYLRYENLGKKFASDYVLIGFMPLNFTRSVNTFRPFLVPDSRIPLAKPRFVLQDHELRLVENPLPRAEDYADLIENPSSTLSRIGKSDYYYRLFSHAHPLDYFYSVRLAKVLTHTLRKRNFIFTDDFTFNPASEAFQVTARTLEKFYRSVESTGATAFIVIMPAYEDFLLDAEGKKRYAYFLKFFEEKNYQFIDLIEFVKKEKEAAQVEALFTPLLEVGHYSELGNRVVARSLINYFRKYRQTL